jgi:hypothetical protein
MQPDLTLGLLARPLFPVLPSRSTDGFRYNSVGVCEFGESNEGFDGSLLSILGRWSNMTRPKGIDRIKMRNICQEQKWMAE